MVNKCVVRCRSNFHGESTIPAFSVPKKHQDLNSERIRYVKNPQKSLTVYVVFITYAFWKKFF